MASGLQLVMEQAGTVRDCSRDSRCVLILHVMMILRTSSTEKIKVKKFSKRKQEQQISVICLLCWLHSQKAKELLFCVFLPCHLNKNEAL